MLVMNITNTKENTITWFITVEGQVSKMTNQKAIEKFKDIMRAEVDRIPSHYDAEAEGEVYSDTDKVDEILKLNKVVCEALEKQIPKKPYGTNGDWANLSMNRCPYCKAYPLNPNDDYCSNCGQAIDWIKED